MPELDSNFQYDVFLSHSAKDKAIVRAVAERLRADGLQVWFDEWEIKPGDSIPAKIEDGLEHSRVLVLCMSANAFGSDWAQLESGTFRFRDPLNKERRFIPLRLDDAPIKGSLGQFFYIDWRSTDRDREYSMLREVSGPPANLLEGHAGGEKLQPSVARTEEHKQTDPTRNAIVTYDERTQIIEIFTDAPPVKISVTSLSSQAGEEFRPVMECAGWLNQAFMEAGVNTQIHLWGQVGHVPDGTNIFWVKNTANNEMVRRIIKAAEVKNLHPRVAPRPVTKGYDIDLMIGNNPYRV
jgi:hypothetical protein